MGNGKWRAAAGPGNQVHASPVAGSGTPTAREREIAALARLNIEKSLVLAQPHRRQFGDDQLAESPLGRFVLRHGLRRELHDAGVGYARLRRRVRAGISAPVPLPGSSLANLAARGGYPAPREIDAAQMHRMRNELARVRRRLNGSAEIIERLVVQELEIASDEAPAAIEGLTALAVELCLLPAPKP
jgi:hypothetical protein